MLHILLSPLFIHACSTLQQRKRAKTNTFPVKKKPRQIVASHAHTAFPYSEGERGERKKLPLSLLTCAKIPSRLLYFPQKHKKEGRRYSIFGDRRPPNVFPHFISPRAINPFPFLSPVSRKIPAQKTLEKKKRERSKYVQS